MRALQSAIVDFVWDIGRHWVNAATVCAPVLHGGLGLVDVADKATAFRFQYVQRYLAAGDADPRRFLTE
jgi:hypothetical protein